MGVCQSLSSTSYIKLKGGISAHSEMKVAVTRKKYRKSYKENAVTNEPRMVALRDNIKMLSCPLLRIQKVKAYADFLIAARFDVYGQVPWIVQLIHAWLSVSRHPTTPLVY